jgi:hypothetical protein
MFHLPLVAAVLLVLSAEFARAQVHDITTGRPEYSGLDWSLAPAYWNSRSPEQAGRDTEIEEKYREAVKKIPDKKASNDPWKSVRPAAPAARPSAAAPTFDRHRAQ